jgi:nucleotide-binding universal stress UspA family protein
MFKHILLPTDGSELSAKAVTYGIALAKLSGAKVTAVTVTTPWQSVALGEMALAIDPDEYDRRTKEYADKTLATVDTAAKAAGVGCAVQTVSSPQPWEAIVEAAQKAGCDLIVMASHGRRGLTGFLLGSETQKVLTHSKIPVLVYR